MPKRQDREPDELRETLTDSDPQIRLNAAVRLAYLGHADGLAELLSGLGHDEAAIGLVQVPEALALLGESGLAPARRLVRSPNPARARAGAARALLHGGEKEVVANALPGLLGEADPVTRREAVALAGELAGSASDAFDGLANMYGERDPEVAGVLPALAAVGSQRAVPLITEALDDESVEVRMSAMRALAGLGPTGTECFARLADVVRTTTSLRERLAAAHALVRVAPDGDTAAGPLVASLSEVDRWSRIGTLRALAQLGPAYPRQPERSQFWPPWEADFVHRVPPPTVDSERAAVLDTLAAGLDDDDHDVRRNAALAIALFGRAGQSIADRVGSAPRIDGGLRYEVLRSLRAVGPPRRAATGAHRWSWQSRRTTSRCSNTSGEAMSARSVLSSGTAAFRSSPTWGSGRRSARSGPRMTDAWALFIALRAPLGTRFP